MPPPTMAKLAETATGARVKSTTSHIVYRCYCVWLAAEVHLSRVSGSGVTLRYLFPQWWRYPQLPVSLTAVVFITCVSLAAVASITCVSLAAVVSLLPASRWQQWSLYYLHFAGSSGLSITCVSLAAVVSLLPASRWQQWSLLPASRWQQWSLCYLRLAGSSGLSITCVSLAVVESLSSSPLRSAPLSSPSCCPLMMTPFSVGPGPQRGCQMAAPVPSRSPVRRQRHTVPEPNIPHKDSASKQASLTNGQYP